MIINRGEPWILWPKKYSYGICKNDVNDVLQGNNSFTIFLDFGIISNDTNKKTLFARLPNYLGIDIEQNNNILFILQTIKDGIDDTRYLFFEDSINQDSNIIIQYDDEKKIVELFLNFKKVGDFVLGDNEKLAYSNESHFIFGAGNFPHNNFNLNYGSFKMNKFAILDRIIPIQDYSIDELIDMKSISVYDFQNKTEFQVWDFSKNYNLISKIV